MGKDLRRKKKMNNGQFIKLFFWGAGIIIAILLFHDIYFNIIISPEKQLEHYLSSKYKNIEFGYESDNEGREGLENKVYLGQYVRWRFEVYPKDNANLKFKVTSFKTMEDSSYDTGSKRSFLGITYDDDLKNAIIDNIEKELGPLDISNSLNDKENAQIIYNALKQAENLNKKFKIKYKYRHYISAEVFVGDERDRVITKIGGKYTLESIMADIERKRDNFLS